MPATHLIMNTAALKRVLWLEQKSRVVISSPRLTPAERKRRQDRMNHLLGVSGYGLGLTTLVAAIVFYMLWVGGHLAFFAEHWFSSFGLGATACLLAGAFGRTLGLLYARCRLARVIQSTAAEMGHSGGDGRGIGAHRASLLTRKTLTQ